MDAMNAAWGGRGDDTLDVVSAFIFFSLPENRTASVAPVELPARPMNECAFEN